jgi:hypothetical protein
MIFCGVRAGSWPPVLSINQRGSPSRLHLAVNSPIANQSPDPSTTIMPIANKNHVYDNAGTGPVRRLAGGCWRYPSLTEFWFEIFFANQRSKIAE